MEVKGLTRIQVADMYGWSTKTLIKLLAQEKVVLPSGTITPKTFELIVLKLGTPPNSLKYKGIVKF